MQSQAAPVSSLSVNNLALATPRVVATALPPAPGVAAPPTESETSGNIPLATGTFQQAPASQPTTSPIGPPFSTTSLVAPVNTQPSSTLGASVASAAESQGQPTTTAQTSTASVSGAASEPPPPVPSSSSSSSSTPPSFTQTSTSEPVPGPSGSAPPPPPPAQSTWTSSTTSNWDSTTSSWVQPSSSVPPPESTWTNTVSLFPEKLDLQFWLGMLILSGLLRCPTKVGRRCRRNVCIKC
jgi:mucin-2